VDAVGATEALRRRLTLRARSRSPGPSLPLLPVLTNVLHPSAQLVLDAEILRALHGGHEGREIVLLAGGQIESAPLDLERLVEQGGDSALIRRITKQHFRTERLAHLPIVPEQQHPFAFEPLVHLPELPHLGFVEIQSASHHLREPFPKLTLEPNAPLRRCASSRRRAVDLLSHRPRRKAGNEEGQHQRTDARERPRASIHRSPALMTGSTGDRSGSADGATGARSISSRAPSND